MTDIADMEGQERHEQVYRVAKRSVVIEDYLPEEDGQLTLSKGEIVYVLEQHESGWWGGHKHGQELTGWFPQRVVQLEGEEILMEEPPDELRDAVATASSEVTEVRTQQVLVLPVVQTEEVTLPLKAKEVEGREVAETKELQEPKEAAEPKDNPCQVGERNVASPQAKGGSQKVTELQFQLSAQAEQLEEKDSALDQCKTQHMHEMRSLEERLAVRDKMVHDLRAELESERRRMKDISASAAARVAEKQAQVHSLECQLEAAQVTSQQLKGQLEDQEAVRHELELRMRRELGKELAQRDQQMRMLQDELRDASDARDREAKHVSGLTEELKQKEVEISKLRAQLRSQEESRKDRDQDRSPGSGRMTPGTPGTPSARVSANSASRIIVVRRDGITTPPPPLSMSTVHMSPVKSVMITGPIPSSVMAPAPSRLPISSRSGPGLIVRQASGSVSTAPLMQTSYLPPAPARTVSPVRQMYQPIETSYTPGVRTIVSTYEGRPPVSARDLPMKPATTLVYTGSSTPTLPLSSLPMMAPAPAAQFLTRVLPSSSVTRINVSEVDLRTSPPGSAAGSIEDRGRVSPREVSYVQPSAGQGPSSASPSAKPMSVQERIRLLNSRFT